MSCEAINSEWKMNVYAQAVENEALHITARPEIYRFMAGFFSATRTMAGWLTIWRVYASKANLRIQIVVVTCDESHHRLCHHFSAFGIEERRKLNSVSPANKKEFLRQKTEPMENYSNHDEHSKGTWMNEKPTSDFFRLLIGHSKRHSASTLLHFDGEALLNGHCTMSMSLWDRISHAIVVGSAFVRDWRSDAF